jgi:hypothetical protein
MAVLCENQSNTMNSQSPSSVLEWIVAEDFFSLKVNWRRILRAAGWILISAAVIASGYVLYVGTFQRRDWYFSVIEETSGKNLATLAGFWLIGIAVLALKLHSAKSSEISWNRLGRYALASTIGAVFTLFIGAACGGVLYHPISSYEQFLSKIFDRIGLAWLNGPFYWALKYMIAAAYAYVGMVAGVLVLWRARRRAEERSKGFWLKHWRPRPVPELTGVPKAGVNGPGSSEGKNQRDS